MDNSSITEDLEIEYEEIVRLDMDNQARNFLSLVSEFISMKREVEQLRKDNQLLMSRIRQLSE